MTLSVTFYPDRSLIQELEGESMTAGVGFVTGDGVASIPYTAMSGCGEVSGGAHAGGVLSFYVNSTEPTASRISMWTLWIDRCTSSNPDSPYSEWDQIFMYSNTQGGAGNPNNTLPIMVPTSINFTKRSSRSTSLNFETSGIQYYRCRIQLGSNSVENPEWVTDTTPFYFKVYCNPRGTKCPLITSFNTFWSGNGWVIRAHTLNNSGTYASYRIAANTNEGSYLSPIVTVPPNYSTNLETQPIPPDYSPNMWVTLEIPQSYGGRQTPIGLYISGYPGQKLDGLVVTGVSMLGENSVNPESVDLSIVVTNKGNTTVSGWAASLNVTNAKNGVTTTYTTGNMNVTVTPGASYTFVLTADMLSSDPASDYDIFAVVV